MSRIIITDEHGNKQHIDLPEKFNVECDDHKTVDVISKESFIRKVKDLVSISNTMKEKTVFPNIGTNTDTPYTC